MVDNIFTRIYGECAETYLKTGDYTPAFTKREKCGYRQVAEMSLVMPSCHMRRCKNMVLLQNVYDNGGSIIITDISYCDIEYLHSLLDINVTITYATSDESKYCQGNSCCCCRPSDRLGYYGVAKGFNGSINQFYYEVENCGEKDLCKKILKGVGADEATLWLQMNVKNSKNPFLTDDSQINIIPPQDTTNDLTRLASAQNITVRVQTDADTRYYYYMPSLRPSRDNSYGINFSIYPCHSLVDNSDYYYIEQEGVYNFNNDYVGEYKYNYEGALSKIEEIYCSEVITDCYLSIDPRYVNIMRMAPETTEGKTTISSGVSFNLGGGVTVDESGVKVTVQGGVSISNSRTITVDAVNVYNRSTDHGSNAKWDYSLKTTESEFSFFSYGQVDLIGASRTGHSTFTPFNQWIWRVLPEGRPMGDSITCTCDLSVNLTSSRGRLVAPGYTGIDRRDFPLFRSFRFNIKQAPSS